MEQIKTKKKVNYKIAIFVCAMPIIGLVSLAALIYFHALEMKTVIFSLIYMFIGALSITAGYHRLFSHQAYKAHPVVRFMFAIIGASQFEGSVIDWCTDHRNHHRYSETEKDPYSITEGFWHAHMGWLIYLDNSKRNYDNVKDLMADPVLNFCHRHFTVLAILMGFIFPMLVCGLFWGDWIGGLLIGGALRIAVNEQTTFCINSICHKFGKQTYSKEQTARDNWITALVTTGEGYHNYHHQFPLDYRNGIKWYHYDPAKWLIKSLHLIGLAKDLRTQSKSKIMQYTITSQESSWLTKWSDRAHLVPHQLEELIAPLKESIMSQLKYIDDCERQIRKIRSNISKMAHDQIDHLKKEIHDYQKKIRHAHADVKQQLRQWNVFIRQTPKLS